MPDSKKTNPIILHMRLGLFLILSLWIMVPPTYREVFHGQNQYFRPWQMFAGIGEGLYRVEYKIKTASEESVINRLKTLGYAHLKDAPAWVRNVTKKNLQQINEGICSVYGKGVDIRLYASRGTRQGWKVVSHGERNICLDKSRR